jgi:hypothetical protein
MILYNVTVQIDKDIEVEWLEWMKSKHIPDVMSTGQFFESRISRLLNEPDEEVSTYVIQYHAESLAHYNRYINEFSAALRDEFNSRYKDKFVLFRTVMEVVG